MPCVPPPADAPPATLDELARLLAALRAGEGPVRLGRRAARTLGMLVDTPRQAAVYSITELAEQARVSPSTLTRLAKRLGYGGFGDLQAVFRRHVARSGHFYSNRAGRIVEGSDGPEIALFERVADEEIGNVRAMLDALDPAAVSRVIERLAGARRVRVHGMRQMFAVACLLSYGLGMLRSDVAVLGVPEHGVGHSLAQLSGDDLLVVVGCAPYTRTTVDVCRIAAEHRYPIVAITDSRASPLASHAEHAFVAPIDSAFFGSSVAAMVVFAECLLSAVARRMGEGAVRALEHREAFLQELSVEY